MPSQLPKIASVVEGPPRTKGLGHSNQLYGHWDVVTHHQALFNRSIFCAVDIYNNLPQNVVDVDSVKAFQRHLIRIVRDRCRQGDAAWALSFSRRTGHE